MTNKTLLIATGLTGVAVAGCNHSMVQSATTDYGTR